MAGVLSHVHVALEKVAEFGLQVDGAVELVVAELSFDRGPDDVGVRLGDADDGEDILGNGVVQLAKDALVEETPFGITALLGGWGRGEVSGVAKLADERVEEGAPLGVVGLGELEHDGNVGLDVHHLENGERGSWDSRSRAGVGVTGDGGGGGRVGVRDVGIEEWIGVHGSGWGTAAEGWAGAVSTVTCGGVQSGSTQGSCEARASRRKKNLS